MENDRDLSDTLNEIIQHAIKQAPLEICGFIFDDNSYKIAENVAKNPEEHFSIRNTELVKAYQKGLKAIFHSHINNPQPSMLDKRRQRASGVPWIIINLVDGKFDCLIEWGRNA